MNIHDVCSFRRSNLILVTRSQGLLFLAGTGVVISSSVKWSQRSGTSVTESSVVLLYVILGAVISLTVHRSPKDGGDPVGPQHKMTGGG